MIQIQEMINRYGKRRVLISVVATLLALNLLKLGYSFYGGQKEELMQRIELLEKYEKSTAKIEAMRSRVKRLEQQGSQLDAYFFTGDSEEEVASAIQIMLQDKVVKAGIDPESIRPTRHGESARGKDFGEISVKIRLSGSFQGFVEFLSGLYKSKKLFKIETFTLKPYKKTELKIFMELKGFYKLIKQENSTSTPKKG